MLFKGFFLDLHISGCAGLDGFTTARWGLAPTMVFTPLAGPGTQHARFLASLVLTLPGFDHGPLGTSTRHGDTCLSSPWFLRLPPYLDLHSTMR